MCSCTITKGVRKYVHKGKPFTVCVYTKKRRGLYWSITHPQNWVEAVVYGRSHSNCPSSVVAWLWGVSTVNPWLVALDGRFWSPGKGITAHPHFQSSSVSTIEETAAPCFLCHGEFATMPSRLVTVMQTEDNTASFHMQLAWNLHKARFSQQGSEVYQVSVNACCPSFLNAVHKSIRWAQDLVFHENLNEGRKLAHELGQRGAGISRAI